MKYLNNILGMWEKEPNKYSFTLFLVYLLLIVSLIVYNPYYFIVLAGIWVLYSVYMVATGKDQE